MMGVRRMARLMLGISTGLSGLLFVATVGYCYFPHNAPLRLLRQEWILAPLDNVELNQTAIGSAGGRFGSVLVFERQSATFGMSGWRPTMGIRRWHDGGIMFFPPLARHASD